MLCSDPRQHESVVSASDVNFRTNKISKYQTQYWTFPLANVKLLKSKITGKITFWSRYILSHIAEASHCFIFSVLKQAGNLKWGGIIRSTSIILFNIVQSIASQPPMLTLLFIVAKYS